MARRLGSYDLSPGATLPIQEIRGSPAMRHRPVICTTSFSFPRTVPRLSRSSSFQNRFRSGAGPRPARHTEFDSAEGGDAGERETGPMRGCDGETRSAGSGERGRETPEERMS